MGAPPSLTSRLVRSLGRTLRRAATGALAGPGRTTARGRPRARSPRGPPYGRWRGRSTYPGDFRGRPPMSFAPHPDGVADPGEIVWTWVPFEEDHARGKDRPVLSSAATASWLLALMLTSKDHDRDEAQEARAGRHWVDIGAGDWDPQGRPSEVRVDRVVRVDPTAVRRAGAALDRRTFEAVAEPPSAAASDPRPLLRGPDDP